MALALPYDIVTELYLGALGWVDVTAPGDVRQGVADSGGGITITRSVPVDGQLADPSTAELVLNNDHGNYSPRNPRSPYYGLLGRNTPIRTALRLFSDFFDRTTANGWAGGWTTIGSAGDYATTPGHATHAHPTINVLRATLRPEVLADVEQVILVKTSAAPVGGALVTGFLARYQDSSNYYWLRCEFDHDSSDVILKISKQVGGVLTDIATLDPVPGLSFTAGVPLVVRAGVTGARLSISVSSSGDPEPADWLLTVVDTSIRAPGRPGVQSWVVAGNTNSPALTASFSGYQLLDRRAWMEVSSWPPRWALSGKDVWVPVQAGGILRRLSQGTKPLKGALYRSYANAESLLAWWPMEEGEQATQAASGIPGQQPLVPSDVDPLWTTGDTGTVAFGVSAAGTGAVSLVSMAGGGQLYAPIPASTATSWRADFVARFKAGTGSATVMNPLSWFGGKVPATGKAYEFSWQFSTAQVLWVGADPDGSSGVILSAPINPYDSILHHYTVELYQDGADVDVYLHMDGVVIDSAVWSAITLPKLTSVVPGYYEHFGDAMPEIGEIAFFAPAPDTVGSAQAAAVNAHADELAADRFERLCKEQGVPVVVIRDPVNPPDAASAMGPQQPAEFLDLLKECVNIDQGLAFDDRGRLGLVLRTGRTLYNQTPLELTYSTHLTASFEPVDDDQRIRNDVTVTRTDGGSYQSIQKTGPLNVQEPKDDPQGVGRYDVEYRLPVATDQQALDQAGWRRHLGTVDEARYPQAKIILTASEWRADDDLTSRATAVDIGDVVDVDGLPAWLPPGPASLLVRGSTEAIDAYARSITWNATPASPYSIATVDGPRRVAGTGSTLAVDLTSSGMSVSLAFTAVNGPWRTTASNPAVFPMPVTIGGPGGEAATASGITGTTSPQTMTLSSRGDNGIQRDWPAGTEINVRYPAVVGM